MSGEFKLAVHAATGRSHTAWLRRRLRQAHPMLKSPLRELSIALVGDRAMSQLHERFLNVPGPTDVLTFPFETNPRGRAISGEVVVCVPEARRAARRLGSTERRELLLYALHGMLHLAGFDDRTAAGFRRMHRREDQILHHIGVGAVFAGGHGRMKSRRQDVPSRRGGA